jgi:hypothetical protein
MSTALKKLNKHRLRTSKRPIKLIGSMKEYKKTIEKSKHKELQKFLLSAIKDENEKQTNDSVSITGIAPDSYEYTGFRSNIKPTKPLGIKPSILSENTIRRQINTFGGKTIKQKKKFAKSAKTNKIKK